MYPRVGEGARTGRGTLNWRGGGGGTDGADGGEVGNLEGVGIDLVAIAVLAFVLGVTGKVVAADEAVRTGGEAVGGIGAAAD